MSSYRFAPWLMICLVILTGRGRLFAEESPEVKKSIALAAEWMRGNISRNSEEFRWLIAYALFKSGEPVTAPSIADRLTELKDRCKDGKYQPCAGQTHGVYQAGVEAMLLAELGPEEYRTELQLISNYLQSRQLPNGAWDYRWIPSVSNPDNSLGDTSLTQYGCLGLWACVRAGEEVPIEVWERTLEWLLKTRFADGGFAYTPNVQINSDPSERKQTLNMSLAGVGTMYLCAIHLFPGFRPGRGPDRRVVAAEKSGRFGILEEVDLNKITDRKERRKRDFVPTTKISRDAVEQAIDKSMQYCSSHFVSYHQDTRFHGYYYYCLERAATLCDVTQMNGKPWYDEGQRELLKRQNADGSWNFGDGTIGGADTPFAVLFLVRSTAKILKRKLPEANFGTGLLKGGRGLPNDLGDLRVRQGDIVSGKKLGELDKLLTSLQDPAAEDLPDVQEQLVNVIQFSDKSELVGKGEALVKLTRHPQAEIRQTAYWALGRSDDLSLARWLIQGLEDADAEAAAEAQRALCWISRRPRGFDLPETFSDLPANSGPDQKQAAQRAWRKRTIQAWGSWYLEHRPYQDRGDDFEADLIGKIRN